MSNNKSKRLARMAGGYKVFLPQRSFQISNEERQKRINFVMQASDGKNVNEVVNNFSEILRTYKRKPEVVDRVSLRTNLSKRLAIKQLIFYAREYRDEVEIRILLQDVW